MVLFDQRTALTVQNAGEKARIDVERSDFAGPALTLDSDRLLIERGRLRKKYGLAFMSEGGAEGRAHLWRWALFQALAESLENRYADDIRQYVEDARQPQPMRRDAA
jgi:hypothetical protein